MTLNHIRRFFTLVLTSVLSVLLSVASVSDLYAQPLSSKMTNGDYQPGVVLLYWKGQWVPATPSRINYSQDNFVFIHGAHSKIDQDKSIELARAIMKHNPKANVLSVDWSFWAVFKENQLDKLVQEEIIKNFDRDKEEIVKNFDDIFEEFLGDVFIRILANVVPIEQTNHIPTVADRAEKILFDHKGTNCALTTDGERGAAIALGLDPKRTCLIGHSHGAHVAGLVAEKCKQRRSKTVARITALDPSPGELQTNGENSDGCGWSSKSARFVDVYRASEICCGDKLYGDVNLFFRLNEHPLHRIQDADNPFDLVDMLLNGLKADIQLHSTTVDIFIELAETDFFWDLPEEHDKKDSGHWIVVDVDDE
ncbi:MAG: hypothetical protein IJL92_06365 [Thermoguttaceae bacterium]|nr:hypothetical protein [Thermoguttaceae bacterium]